MGSLHRQLCYQHRHICGWFVTVTGQFQKCLFQSCILPKSSSRSLVVRPRIDLKSLRSCCSNSRTSPNANFAETSGLPETGSTGIETRNFDPAGQLFTFLKGQGENTSSLNIHEMFQQIKNLHVTQSEKEISWNSEDHSFFESLNSTIWEILRQLPTQEAIEFLLLLLQDKSVLGFQNIAIGIGTKLFLQLDIMDENAFSQFVRCLQLPSASGEPFYTYLKNYVSDCDLMVTNTVKRLTEEKGMSLNIWPSLLLDFAKAGLDFRLEPLPLLCQQIFQHLNQMSFDDLKASAELICILKKETSWFAGSLLQIFQDKICKIDSPSAFTSIACSVIQLSSSHFKHLIFDKFEELFNPSSDHTVDDLITMMKISLHFESQPKLKILEKCSSLLRPFSDKMSLSQVVAFLATCRYLYFKPDVIYNQLFSILNENAKHLTNERDTIQAADLLSQGHRDLCEDMVLKLLRILDNDGTTDWSKMCAVALRVTKQHPQIANKLRDKCLELLPDIQDVALLNTLARLVKLKCSPKSSAQNFLKEKLITSSYRALTPRELSCIVSGLRKLGLEPNQIDPFVWIQMRKFLPTLGGESSRRILAILGNFKFIHIHPHDHSELCHLQRDVFHKILHKDPPKHLLLDRVERQSTSDTIVTSRPTDNNGDTCSSITSSNVIGISLFLHQTRMYYSDILNKIVEVLSDDVHAFTPYEIRDAVFVLSSCGVTHPEMENICQAFVKKLVTFFDEMGPFLVVESAVSLAKLQFFDPTLLRKIFVWQFLEKTEELRQRPVTSHLLMQINRAVCLEYPELQVPWFHQEVNTETHDWKIKWNRVKDDVYLGLCDLLGEDGVVKTGATTPYNYLVDFEFCCNVGDILDVRSKARKKTEKIAVDVLPRSCYFRNEPSRLTAEFIMKKRHLEILGYRYIPIPYHGWDRNLLHRSDKVNYLRKHMIGQLHHGTEEGWIFQEE